jgi:hypothetical protein
VGGSDEHFGIGESVVSICIVEENPLTSTSIRLLEYLSFPIKTYNVYLMAIELVVLPIPPQRLSALRFRYVEFVTLITTQPVLLFFNQLEYFLNHQSYYIANIRNKFDIS